MEEKNNNQLNRHAITIIVLCVALALMVLCTAVLCYSLCLNALRLEDKLDKLQFDVDQIKARFEAGFFKNTEKSADAGSEIELDKSLLVSNAIRELEEGTPIKKADAALIIEQHAAEIMLGDYGEDTRKDAVDRLVNLLDDGEAFEVRVAAARALQLVRDKKAVPALIRMLENMDEDPITKAVAARSLGNYGRDARIAFDTLVKLLDHQDADIRAAATNSLRGLRDKRALPLFLRMAQDEDDNVERAAKAGLVELSKQEDLRGAGRGGRTGGNDVGD